MLTLPWHQPLADWQDERLVEIRQRGISRHVVRFVADNGKLFALKSISESLARREYRLLRALAATDCPMSCPHGRPIALHYSTREILKAFHRM